MAVTANVVAIQDALDAPRTLPEPAPGSVNLTGWLPVRPLWAATLNGISVMSAPEWADAHAEGRLRYVPVRYSALPRLLAGPLRPAVAVVTGRPAGRGFKFGGGVGYALVAASLAGEVVVEVDESLPDLDAPAIPITKSVHVTEAASPRPDAPERDLAEVDRKIGSAMADLVPPGATVQYGPGSIGESSIRALSVRVRIHSGIVTEAVADLSRRGFLDGVATATYLFGGAGLNELARSGLVRLRGVEETHSPQTLAGVRRFVALNTALQVGLDGSVNVERIGTRQVGGIGGHSDFCRAATTSDDGLSVIGLRSTRGSSSTIVPRVDVVSTPRSDVDIVVTEWGMADLRGLGNRSRAYALIAVANPRFHDALEGAIAQLAV